MITIFDKLQGCVPDTCNKNDSDAAVPLRGRDIALVNGWLADLRSLRHLWRLERFLALSPRTAATSRIAAVFF